MYVFYRQHKFAIIALFDNTHYFLADSVIQVKNTQTAFFLFHYNNGYSNAPNVTLYDIAYVVKL
jgi:hypothetical protein